MTVFPKPLRTGDLIAVTAPSSGVSGPAIARLDRALLSLRRHRWFDGLSGLLIGRSAGPAPNSPDSLSYTEALTAALGDLPYPVLYDVDIGHQPPQFTLINGAVARVQFIDGRGSIDQAASA
jgi:muramoyltetrapeptide carboxypeptidase LdcA involved in peptidoglycan recycling